MGDLGMFGFWIFIGAAAVAGIWSEIKEKESKQETLRRVVESGQNLDQEMIDQMLGVSDTKSSQRDLRTGAYIMGGVAAGLLLFSFFLGRVSTDAGWILTGVSSLVACIGGGMFVAANRMGQNNASE